MNLPTIKTTPKMTVHIDAHCFAHPRLEDDIIIGTSTCVTPKNVKTVAVVSINEEAFDIGDYASGWQEILGNHLDDFLRGNDADREETFNYIENAIHAELQKLGVSL